MRLVEPQCPSPLFEDNDGSKHTTCHGTVEWKASCGERFRITVADDDIVRVQLWPDGRPRLDVTWTTVGGDGDVPLAGRPREDLRHLPLPRFTATHTQEGVDITTAALKVAVKTQGRFALSWQSVGNSKPFAEDMGKRAYVYDRSSQMVRHYMKRGYIGESYFGFGEHSGPLNKKGRHLRMLCMDSMGYDAESTGCLYKHFPVYITYVEDLNVAYGLLYDSMSAGTFDMGNEIDAFRGFYKYYQQDHGDLDYYLLFGPSVEAVVEKITLLTGRPRVSPKWGLGYLGSTMTYTEAADAQEQLRRFPALCKQHDVPCDGFHLSSGYTTNPEGARCVFTWNLSKVPDPPGLVAEFRQHNLHLIPNVKPWLLTCHPKYAEVVELGGFLRNDDGTVHTEEMWAGGANSSGDGAYFDFTGDAGFSWWKTQVKEQLLEHGMDAVWNDNNEYEVWDDDLPLANGRQLGVVGRPLQTLLMARASLAALAEHGPARRPFLVSRSACLGMQRYCSQSWSGDNVTSWATLRYNLPMGLSLSLSGFPNTGHDIGGFAGPAPDPELLVRWVQQGVMHPRFSIHSWNTDGTVNEPWMYEEALPAVREAIRFRYQLLPYLYSLHIEASRTGHPILRPMVYYFAADEQCRDESFDFMLGPSLLVACVLEPGTRSRSVYLPPGEMWCDWRTGQWHAGGTTATVAAPLDGPPPLLARGNRCVLMGPVEGNCVSPALDAQRTLLAFPVPAGAEFTAQFYEDDGISVDPSGSAFTLEVHVAATSHDVAISARNLGPAPSTPYPTLLCKLPPGDPRTISFAWR